MRDQNTRFLSLSLGAQIGLTGISDTSYTLTLSFLQRSDRTKLNGSNST